MHGIAVRGAVLALRIESISTLAPTLEDVFLSFTIHAVIVDEPNVVRGVHVLFYNRQPVLCGRDL